MSAVALCISRQSTAAARATIAVRAFMFEVQISCRESTRTSFLPPFTTSSDSLLAEKTGKSCNLEMASQQSDSDPHVHHTHALEQENDKKNEKEKKKILARFFFSSAVHALVREQNADPMAANKHISRSSHRKTAQILEQNIIKGVSWSSGSGHQVFCGSKGE